MDNETATQIAMNKSLREKLDQMTVASTYRNNKDTELTIREVENGRVVLLGSKTYIVAPGQPLLEVISQALVEAQLEK